MSIFNEGFIDTELFWLSFGGVISNMVIATVIIAEVGFVIWLLLKWLRGNVNINWSPTVQIGESVRSRVDSSIETFKERVKRDMGPVEVDVQKKIILSDADESSIKTDEVKRGKVKTQKDKLKALRGK
jgi:hypothetical protein